MHFLVPNIPLWILLIPVKVRRRIPDTSHLEFDCSEREIRGWVMARQSLSLRYWEWIGGLQLWNCSYALHTVLIPSSYGVTEYCDKLVTSKDTKILSRGTLVLSVKLMKSFVSLRYDFCCCTIGWSCLSAKFDSRRAFAVRNNWFSFLWFVDFCHGIQNWDSWRVASLRKPFLARGELSGWLGNQDPDV